MAIKRRPELDRHEEYCQYMSVVNHDKLPLYLWKFHAVVKADYHGQEVQTLI